MTIETDLNIHEAGSYEVKIIALDINHLKSEKKFTIVVKEEDEKDNTQEAFKTIK